MLNTSTTRTMMCSTRMQVHVCFTNHGLITCQVWGDFVHHPMLLATSHASLRHLELPCAPLLPRRPPVCGFYCQSFPKHKWRRGHFKYFRICFPGANAPAKVGQCIASIKAYAHPSSRDLLPAFTLLCEMVLFQNPL